MKSIFFKSFFKAFTLIEVLVVIAIIMLIVGVSFTALSNRQNYEYKTEVDKIYKIITDAQANATKSSPVITINNPNLALNQIGFRLPTNIPQVPPNQSYIVSLRITKILNNNDTLSMEFFEKLSRRIVIDNINPNRVNQGALINNNNLFNIPNFYNQTLFLNNNHPISYILLIGNIGNNRSQLLPIVFRTDGSLAADTNTELYVGISHSSNRFRTYFIGINGKNIRKYVR